MKLIWNHIKKKPGVLIGAALAMLCGSACSLFLPYLFSELIESGIRVGDMSYILKVGLQMLLVCVAAVACGIVSVRCGTVITTNLNSRLYHDTFNKINSLTMEEFGSIGTASLLTRSTEDLNWAAESVSSLVYVLVVVPFLFIGGCVLAFLRDWMLALSLLAGVPLVFLIVYIASRHQGEWWQKSDDACDLQNKVVRERLGGLRVIRSFGKEEYEHSRIAAATRTMCDFIIKANVRGGYINPLSILLLDFITIALLLVGGARLQNSALGLRVGDIVATLQYVALILNALLVASWTLIWYPHFRVCMGRVEAVYTLPGLPDEPTEAPSLPGEVELEQLCFRFPGAEEDVLKDISLRIPAGQTAAVIGGTGSGKTTLLKLLLQFYKPTGGEIRLGGEPYSELSRAKVRAHISPALQKAAVFEGSIAENVRMGREDATDEEIRTALTDAQLIDFVDAQKEGLEYACKQSGANLSGGQKQRISIARCIIKPAEVYIFDDSFSALDFLTESRLRRALATRLKGKTQIVITQRAATAMRSDAIFVLDGGALVGSGSHADLMKNCRVYREIVESQLGVNHA
ncbi:MAG: ABC transporter ATP-binding protein/permease [Clostridiales bacterium]|nr:ABC transporter ATP-binding protein/permease [Clostridiales bacterium]